MKRMTLIIWAVLILLMPTACEHKALCYLHEHADMIRVNVDWSKFEQEEPTGMSIFFYPDDPDMETVRVMSNTTSHAYVRLQPARYRIVVHNQSPSEFGSFIFHDMERQDAAAVRTDERKSKWYQPVEGEKLGAHSEWLAFDIQEAEVTQEMIDSVTVDDHLTKSADADTTGALLTLTPLNIIYTLHVSIGIEGIQNYRAARAAVTGMADGYRPGTGEYHDEDVTHLLESWVVADRTEDSQGGLTGRIVSEITCFGLPHGHEGNPEDNKLHLTLLLADNKTYVEHTFDVGDLFRYKMRENDPMHLHLDLMLPGRLPDVDYVEDDASGFDAVVEDWGEEINQDIGL